MRDPELDRLRPDRLRGVALAQDLAHGGREPDEAARAATRGAAELTHVVGGIDTLFNERPYDDRGWCE